MHYRRNYRIVNLRNVNIEFFGTNIEYINQYSLCFLNFNYIEAKTIIVK